MSNNPSGKSRLKSAVPQTMNPTPQSEKTTTASPPAPPRRQKIIWAYIFLALLCISGCGFVGSLIPLSSNPNWSNEPMDASTLLPFFFTVGGFIGVLLTGNAISFPLKHGDNKLRAFASLILIAVLSFGFFTHTYRAAELNEKRLAEGTLQYVQPRGPEQPVLSSKDIQVITILIFLSIPTFFATKGTKKK